MLDNMVVYLIDLWINLQSTPVWFFSAGLQAPVDITTQINGNQVIVSWKDHNEPELVSGAYAVVSESHSNELGPPVFIHSEDTEAKTIIFSGLMPQMTYSIRVSV